MRIRKEAQAQWDRLNEEARTQQSKNDLVTYVNLWVNAMEHAQSRGDDFLVFANQVAQRATQSPAKAAIFEEAANILAEVWNVHVSNDGERDKFRKWNQARKNLSPDS